MECASCVVENTYREMTSNVTSHELYKHLLNNFYEIHIPIERFICLYESVVNSVEFFTLVQPKLDEFPKTYLSDIQTHSFEKYDSREDYSIKCSQIAKLINLKMESAKVYSKKIEILENYIETIKTSVKNKKEIEELVNSCHDTELLKKDSVTLIYSCGK